MKKFHTLPGVIPRVGVAEGRGAFARWSFTASAALLLLLSAEGAQGADPTPSPTPTPTVAELDKRVDELNAKISKLETRKRIIDENQKGRVFKETDPKLNQLANEVTDIDEKLAKAKVEREKARSALKAATSTGSETPTISPTTSGNQSDSGLGGSEQTRGTFKADITTPRNPQSQFTVPRPSQIGGGSGGVRSSSGTTTAANGASTNTSNTTAAAASGTTSATTTTTTGGGGTGLNTSAYTSDIDGWGKRFDNKRLEDKKAPNADPCVISAELGEVQGGIYKCAGTTRAVKNAQDITGGAVVAGTVGMAMKNQNAVNDALKSGSQSGNLDAQASIQAGQEDISKTIGVIQMTQALMLKSKADSHGKNIRQLEGNLVKDSAFVRSEDGDRVLRHTHNEDATAALEKFINTGNVGLRNGIELTKKPDTSVELPKNLDVGILRKADIGFGDNASTAEAVAKDLNAAVKKVGNAAVAEQKDIQDKASVESMKLFQQAAIAFTVAEQARKNKEILRQTAQSVKQVEKSTKDLAFQFAPNDRSANQLAAPNQSLSLSSAQDASQSKTDGLGQNGTDEPGESPNFDSPYGAPTDPIPQPSPQPVGDFQRNPNGGGGGGGGGAGGGTSTQPSGNDDDHGGGGSTYAKLATTSDKYSAGGGGVGGSGGGGNAGMDFTGMLSQFLPKPEDQGPKNGILDFGARAPAQTALPSSLLDASANLFERVHEAYQSKNRKGQVGQAVSGGKNP